MKRLLLSLGKDFLKSMVFAVLAAMIVFSFAPWPPGQATMLTAIFAAQITGWLTLAFMRISAWRKAV